MLMLSDFLLRARNNVLRQTSRLALGVGGILAFGRPAHVLVASGKHVQKKFDHRIPFL